MDFFSGLERAVIWGLSVEDYKTMWESEIRKSEFEAEREVLKLRKENDHYQSTKQDQMMEYFQEKFQELREEITWLKKHLLETILRHSAMTNEKIDASMKHLEQCISDERMKTGSKIKTTDVAQQATESSKNMTSMNSNIPTSTNLQSHQDLLQETEQTSPSNIHRSQYELPVGARPEPPEVIYDTWLEHAEEDVDLYYPTRNFQKEADTPFHENTLEFGWSQNDDLEWQTVGHDGKSYKNDDERSMRNTGLYDERISQKATGQYAEQVSQKATGPYAEQISQMFLKNKSLLGNVSISDQMSSKFETHCEEFTIDNVKEFFKAKTTLETNYFWSLPVKFKYKMQFRFNKKNQLEVRILLLKCELDNIPQSPITFSCVGKIFNPQSRRHTKLWTLDCTVMNDVRTEMELQPAVCLDTLRGSYSPVTYDTLAKRHYDLQNRFDFMWTVTAQ
ncbi:hypothetical protein Btru_048427 [Bulinus truncatus]|nr:hypothetical protein Btru_048427 [Bulinus truncatus]